MTKFLFLTLCCSPITVVTAQLIGLHTTNPAHPVHIKQPVGLTLGLYDPVLHVEYTGTNLDDAVAVQGVSKPADAYGIGGRFEGGFIGVQSLVYPTGNGTYHGVLSDVTGTGTGSNYAIHGRAEGPGINYGLWGRSLGFGVNYGVYGDAWGGTTNWAGYFDDGDVYIKNKLGIAINPVHPVHINQPSGTTLTSGQPVLHVEYTETNAADPIAIRGKCRPQDFYGKGGFFEGGFIGVQGRVNPTGNSSYYGVYGEAFGGSGTNFGVFGSATGTGTNWAGYFNNGNVYVNNRLGIARSPATNRLEVEGNASKSSAGDWLANSDERLKKNIQPLNAQVIIEKMLTLKGVTYEWNDDKTGSSRPEGIQYGFTAQNIQSVFPTLVEEDALGYLQTAYGTYDAMMIEAIRFLYDENKSLKEELAEIKKQINSLASVK